jgi:SAM-dependent methyltransferase
MTTARDIARDHACSDKAGLRAFLARNPFPNAATLGFFYREKMRAIHEVTPRAPLKRILDVGGGQSGLTALLYPDAYVTILDVDPGYGRSSCNQWPGVEYVCGDAVAMPFDDDTFDAVMLFDVLEHVREDARLVAEVQRVLKTDGIIVVSTPNENWRYPYYAFMESIAPPEQQLMQEWGHVRRGYSLSELTALFGRPPERTASFINPFTALGHDISFATVGHRARLALWLLASPITLTGYALGKFIKRGTETAALWKGR